MAITRSILELEKCNGYQNLQKNISNYVFLYHFSLTWTVFELFTKTAIFIANKSESLSLPLLSNAL